MSFMSLLPIRMKYTPLIFTRYFLKGLHATVCVQAGAVAGQDIRRNVYLVEGNHFILEK